MRNDRLLLKLSQTRLAALSRVRRERICYAESGYLILRLDEQERILVALRDEAERLRGLAVSWEPYQAGTRAAA